MSSPATLLPPSATPAAIRTIVSALIPRTLPADTTTRLLTDLTAQPPADPDDVEPAPATAEFTNDHLLARLHALLETELRTTKDLVQDLQAHTINEILHRLGWILPDPLAPREELCARLEERSAMLEFPAGIDWYQDERMGALKRQHEVFVGMCYVLVFRVWARIDATGELEEEEGVRVLEGWERWMREFMRELGRMETRFNDLEG